MQLDTILSPGRTQCGAPGISKKRTLEDIARFICEDIPTLDANDLFDNLVARERLGSTGLGQGIAIPHSRMKSCNNIIGSLIKLERPVDFDAIDNEPVDLLFVLLVPEQATDEHLKVLSELAQRFSNPQYCHNLRQAEDNAALFAAAVADYQ